MNLLAHCLYEWGCKASVINKTYLDCKKEAKFLGQETNLDFIKEMMFDILCENNKLCAEKFIESKQVNFQEFLVLLLDEELIDEDVLSTGFAPSQKPEGGPKAKPVTIGLDDEDENEKNKKQQDAV